MRLLLSLAGLSIIGLSFLSPWPKTNDQVHRELTSTERGVDRKNLPLGNSQAQKSRTSDSQYISTAAPSTPAISSEEVSPDEVEKAPDETYAEVFYRKLAPLPILEQRQAYHEAAQVAFREDLLYKADYRFPSLVRRYYDDGKGRFMEGSSRFVEVQVADQFLIQLKSDSNQGLKLEQIPRDLRSKMRDIRQISEGTLVASFRFKDLEERENIRRRLAELSEISGVFNDTLGFVSATLPNDPLIKNLWNFENDGVNRSGSIMIHQTGVDSKVTAAWDYGNDCSAIPIAILDTGIDYTHPDLQDNVVMGQSRSFVTGVSDFRDDNYHGTHVAGIIAAVGNNKSGISGVCWKAKILAVKVMDSTGSGAYSEIVAGLNYVAKSDARIVNASIGIGPLALQPLSPNEPMVVAVKELEKSGKLLVAAGGNNGITVDDVLYLPLKVDSPAVIGVASTKADGSRSEFSNFGAEIDIAAPGSEILSTVPMVSGGIFPPAGLLRENGTPVSGYGYLSGTSMASPMVAGILALFWSQVPLISGIEVKRLLLTQSSTATLDLGIPNNLSIDAAKLLKGSVFKFELDPAGGEIIAGKTARVAVKVTQKGFFELSSIKVLNQNASLAEAPAPATSITFTLPSGSDLSLIVSVKDSAGRVYESEPLPMSQAPASLDFDKILLNSSGRVRCSLVQKSSGKAELLHEALVADKITCLKFCDVVKPLLNIQTRFVSCGPELKF